MSATRLVQANQSFGVTERFVEPRTAEGHSDKEQSVPLSPLSWQRGAAAVSVQVPLFKAIGEASSEKGAFRTVYPQPQGALFHDAGAALLTMGWHEPTIQMFMPAQNRPARSP